MIRQPAIAKTPRGLRQASSKSLPAPVGGWNARDPLAAMKAIDAVVLENWFPSAATVDLRPGSRAVVTGFPKQVERLLTWNGAATDKLFATTADGIYNATAESAVGAIMIALTNGQLESVNFSVTGGHYLVAVNGVDKLKLYEGTAWQSIDATTTPAITGLATTLLANVAVIKRRLWFVQKESMSAWYLPVAQVGGALSEFPLGQVFSRGGRLVAIANWTFDGGDGVDDYTVFATSQGEIAVYKGSDPSSSTTWAKVGTYHIGEPLGPRCFCKFGGDLLFLCQAGLFPLSKALLSATIDRRQALTSKVDQAFSEAVSFYGGNPGWEAVLYPEGSFLLVNIPITSAFSYQYVMNTITGAWCKFVGMPGQAWAIFRKKLYFAERASVGQAWTGRSDYGQVIVGRAQQAYNAFDQPARQKHMELIRPTIMVAGKLTLQIGFDTDYRGAGFGTVNFSPNPSFAVWDTSKWNQAIWGASLEQRQDWATVFAPEFYVGGLRVQCSTNTATVKWSATDFIFTVGGLV